VQPRDHATHPLRLVAEDRQRLRHGLLRRGQVLATLLAEVLAGKKPPALTAMLTARPGKRPEEVLREALAQVEQQRQLIDDDDDGFGRCGVCGLDLGVAALHEVPWADRCHQHAAD
jgi:hypothetical protein